MVVFLLLVIIAILLFGSSAVLGVVGMVLGFIALVLAAFFGVASVAALLNRSVDDIFVPLMLCLMALPVAALGVLAALKWFFSDRHRSEPNARRERPCPDAPADLRSPNKKIWDSFARDIQDRFSVEDQVRAHDIYKSGDADALRRHCESVLHSLSAPVPPG